MEKILEGNTHNVHCDDSWWVIFGWMLLFYILFVISKFYSTYYFYNQEVKKKNYITSYTLPKNMCSALCSVCLYTCTHTHTVARKPFSDGKETYSCLCRWKGCGPIFFSTFLLSPWKEKIMSPHLGKMEERKAKLIGENGKGLVGKFFKTVLDGLLGDPVCSSPVS